MSDPVKIRKFGNSLGVTLSDHVREMGLAEGDSLYVVKTAAGIELTPTIRISPRRSMPRATSCAGTPTR